MCVWLLTSTSMPSRHVEHHRVRVAQREHDLLALLLGAIADADDVELLLEAIGDAGDGVGHQRARQAVELAQRLVVADQARRELAVGQGEGDARRQRLTQLALRVP